VEPALAEDRNSSAILRVPDYLPSVVNGLRAFTIIMVIAVFWIVSAWPSGPSAIVFAAIIVLLMSPQGDAAVANSLQFFLGTMFTSVLAAIAAFALLPGAEGFVKLALVMGLFLLPTAAMSAGKWYPAFFVAATANFTPLLAPSNIESYNTAAFYNSTLAIGLGVGAGVMSLSLLPQLSPARRTARLRRLALRDLHRLATRRRPVAQRDWETLTYARINALPPSASPVARAELVASLYVGEAVLRLRALAARYSNVPQLPAILQAIAEGRDRTARGLLEAADETMASCGAGAAETVHARAAMLALREALTRHGGFFGGE
jgi:uncharacterized membrane protein YccC